MEPRKFNNYKANQRCGLWEFCFINTKMQELLVRIFVSADKIKLVIDSAMIVTTALFTFMHGGAFEAGIISVL